MSQKFRSKARIVGITPTLNFNDMSIQPLKNKYKITKADQEIINILKAHCGLVETEIQKIKFEKNPTKKDEKQMLNKMAKISKKIHGHYVSIMELIIKELSPLISVLQAYGPDTLQALRAVEESFAAIQQAALAELQSVDANLSVHFPYATPRDFFVRDTRKGFLDWTRHLNQTHIAQKVYEFNVLAESLKKAENYLKNRQGYPGKTLQKTIVTQAAALYCQLTDREPRENFKYTLGDKSCTGEFYEFLQDFFTMIRPALNFSPKELRQLLSVDDAPDSKKIFDGKSWGKCVRSYLQEAREQTQSEA